MKNSCSLEAHPVTSAPIKSKIRCLYSANRFVLKELRAFRQLLTTKFVWVEEMVRWSCSMLIRTSANLCYKLSCMEAFKDWAQVMMECKFWLPPARAFCTESELVISQICFLPKTTPRLSLMWTTCQESQINSLPALLMELSDFGMLTTMLWKPDAWTKKPTFQVCIQHALYSQTKSFFQAGQMARSEHSEWTTTNNSGKLTTLTKMELQLSHWAITTNSLSREDKKVKLEYGKLDQENSLPTSKNTRAKSLRSSSSLTTSTYFLAPEISPFFAGTSRVKSVSPTKPSEWEESTTLLSTLSIQTNTSV